MTIQSDLLYNNNQQRPTFRHETCFRQAIGTERLARGLHGWKGRSKLAEMPVKARDRGKGLLFYSPTVTAQSKHAYRPARVSLQRTEYRAAGRVGGRE